MPQAFVAVSVTVYVPATAYMYVGFWSVDVFPSPKSQAQDVGAPVEASVNCTAAVPAHPCVAVKSATGATPVTVTVCDAGALAPQGFVAVSVTAYVPATVYMCDGFCNVDVFPSPKSQLQEIGVSVDVSVNCTATVPAHPCVAVKSATGAAPVVIVTVCDASAPAPQGFDTTSVTM